MREDIAFAKEAGFDFLRIHIKIDDPLLLHYADTLGMLLMTDFPNFGEGGDTPLGRARFETMMRAAVERDFNHPSIIAWCMFNETWGFGGQVELMKWIEEHNLKAREETAAGADQPKEEPPAPAAYQPRTAASRRTTPRRRPRRSRSTTRAPTSGCSRCGTPPRRSTRRGSSRT